jgi:hypothetical protein
VFVLLSVVIVTALLGGSMMGAAGKGDASDGSLYKYLSVFTEVLSLVRQSYVDATGMDGLMSGSDGRHDRRPRSILGLRAARAGRRVRRRQALGSAAQRACLCSRSAACPTR